MQHSIPHKRIFVKLLSSDSVQDEKYLEVDIELDKEQYIQLDRLICDFVDRELLPIKSQVFYLDTVQKYFIFVGDFKERCVRLPARVLLVNNCLTLLCKKVKISDEALANPTLPELKKRAKERTIREVIISCKQWRRLYHEGSMREGLPEKLTLDESAMRIGISRKTLEDYYKQLRDGCRYKFDFARHKDEKMGVLRTFVKKNAGQKTLEFELKKPESQVEKQTFHYIQLCLTQEVEEPRLMYGQDIGMYLIAEPNHVNMQDSSSSASSDEPFAYDYQE